MSVMAMPIIRPSVKNDPVTPEDLLNMEEQGLFELVDGKLLEKNLGMLGNLTAGKITTALHIFAKPADLGIVLPGQSFQCFPDAPTQVRRPDIAFITTARVPNVLPTGHVKIAPDIAIEVISPNDSVYELDEKLADYRSAGVPLIWIVNPDARVIRVFRPGQPIEELRDGEILNGDTVLPGFAANVTDLLPARAPKNAEATI